MYERLIESHNIQQVNTKTDLPGSNKTRKCPSADARLQQVRKWLQEQPAAAPVPLLHV